MDIQFFTSDGVWHRPENAMRVDLMMRAGGTRQNQNDAKVFTQTFHAPSIPEHVDVEVGQAAPGGLPGYVVVVVQTTKDVRPGTGYQFGGASSSSDSSPRANEWIGGGGGAGSPFSGMATGGPPSPGIGGGGGATHPGNESAIQVTPGHTYSMTFRKPDDN